MEEPPRNPSEPEPRAAGGAGEEPGETAGPSPPPLPPFLRSLPARVALALVFAISVALGFLPLFGGPRYESALAAGLVVPLAAALVTALEVSRAQAAPEAALGRGYANGAALAAAFFAPVFAHGARVGLCDPIGGAAHLALGPLPGALLGGLTGAIAGEIAGSRRRAWARRALAVGLALAGPLGGIAVSLARFYSTPIVFAYDPYFGFFSGTLYDTVVDLEGLVTYRAGTAATLLGAWLVSMHLARDARGRVAYRPIGRPGLLLAGLVAVGASFAAIALGHRLGHWQTPATIAEALGGRLDGERCVVVYAREIPRDDVRRFLGECDAHVELGDRFFGARGPEAITAYLFSSARQKGELMGAAGTYIAKPWRREIYVQISDYPHPVIGHEIAHVIAGSFARGPFRVAGSLGGLVPDPGLIEGVAVAASPREGDLSPRDWAKAMKDLGLLPRIGRLFGLGFLAENSSTAYTVSGAFVGYVRERFGADVVRGWYGGGSLEALTGASMLELERAFLEDLDAVALGDAAMAQAKARFDRPAIFGRRCPREVDACRERADVLRAAGDFEGAADKLEEARGLDPRDAGTRLALALVRVRAGEAGAEAELEAIAADAELPVSVRDRALEELGDLALGRGDGEKAAMRYDEAMARIVDEDRLRTLEVKKQAAAGRGRDAILALLVGVRGRGPDRVLAAELLASWAGSSPGDGLPLYLLARQHVSSGDMAHAASKLDDALARTIDLPRVLAEAIRLRIVAACGLGDAEAALRLLPRYEGLPVASEARRQGVRAFVERCALQTRGGPTAGAELPAGRP